MNEVFISYGDETLVIDTKDIGELECAMRFKAEHIKAKAEPRLFEAVADALMEMRDIVFLGGSTMKIDEASINHNCMLLINDTADSCWEIVGEKDAEIIEHMRMAYIDGIMDLASNLKLVLKE